MARGGIEHVDEGKAVEITVVRINGPHAVLSHQNCGLDVEDDIAGDTWNLGEHFGRHMRMPLGLDEHA